MPENTFVCHNGRKCYWHLVGEDQRCCKAHCNAQDSIPSHPTAKNYLAKNVNNAEVEKLHPLHVRMLGVVCKGSGPQVRGLVPTQCIQILLTSISGTCLDIL